MSTLCNGRLGNKRESPLPITEMQVSLAAIKVWSERPIEIAGVVR